MKTIGPVLPAIIGPALLTLVLIIAACTTGAAPTSGPSPTATRAPVGATGPDPVEDARQSRHPSPLQPTPIVGATPAPTAAPSVDSGQTPAAAAAAFFLEIAAPKDESVVREASVLVRGRTVPDAVVSVNGQSVEVDASGNFAATVTLEEGPNSIEVISSDFHGHHQSGVISLIYTR